jgi:hypothetical protein
VAAEPTGKYEDTVFGTDARLLVQLPYPPTTGSTVRAGDSRDFVAKLAVMLEGHARHPPHDFESTDCRRLIGGS